MPIMTLYIYIFQSLHLFISNHMVSYTLMIHFSNLLKFIFKHKTLPVKILRPGLKMGYSENCLFFCLVSERILRVKIISSEFLA